MDLSTIEMPVDEARAALTAYRRSVKDRQEAEVAQIMRGYRELAKGSRLISLTETLRTGGLRKHVARGGHEVYLPALAVAKADERTVRVQLENNGTVTFAWKDEAFWNQRSRQRIRVPAAFNTNTRLPHLHRQFRAMVPLVPPPLRPAHKLSGYVVLWEAEWRLDPPPPPRDPALLKHIGGDLYAVLAVWDLTEIERAVLSGR